MTIDELKQELQRHFADKMITIVGSGLSASLGLPTMGVLASALLRDLPSVLNTANSAIWEPVANELRSGTDLETALSHCDNDDLNQRIREIVSREIGSSEKNALKRMFAGTLRSPFSLLLKHLTFSNGRAEVITPNYDRLIEFSTELAGYGVDTTFTGCSFGKFNERISRDSLSEFTAGKPGRNPIVRKYRAHIVVYKPHGSLDWYLQGDTPVRCTAEVDAPRLMITPGANKYRLGYNSPFDVHREAANRAIDNASRFLIIGYGFNDEQLEQHLRAKLRSGYPALLLTRALTPNAERIVQDCPSIRVLCQAADAGTGGSLHIKGTEREFFPSIDLWDLSKFAPEVLGA